ncbi:MAG: phosphotransferase family protein [Dehalococcoidia bacterium]
MDPHDCALAMRASGLAPLAEPTPILGGWSFWTFAAGELIARFPTTDEDAAGLEREFRLLPVLADRLGVPVPQYITHATWQGRPFGVYRRLAGVGLDDESVAGRVPESVWPDLGRALRALHALPPSLVEGFEAVHEEPFWDRLLTTAIPLLAPPLRSLASAEVERYRRSTTSLRTRPPRSRLRPHPH